MSEKSSFRSEDDELDRLVGLGITRQQVESGDDCLDCLDPEVLASYADGGLSEAERAEIDGHLARCRDCRRALALLLESDPAASVGAGAGGATSMASSPLSVRHTGKADDSVDAAGRAIGASPRATGAPASAGSPQVGGSRIVHSAKIWVPLAAALVVATGLWFAFDRSRQVGGSAPAAMLNARNEAPAASQPAAREGLAPPRAEDGARPSAAASGLEERAAAPADQAATKERQDGFVAARPEGEAGGRYREAAPARPAGPAPQPPPPPPAALADAAPAPAAPPAQDQTVGAAQAKQAARVNQAAQNVAQQAYAANQQTGPMSNLNVAPPPPPKTDDRRQTDASKGEASEKTSIGGSSSARSADEKFAKVAEEPNALARAKAAPDGTAAPAPAEPAPTAVNAASGGAAPGASASSGGKASGATAPGSTSAGAPDTAAREISEAVTSSTTGGRAASAVLRSADGTRWWRIRAPGTIEGSGDRGATWTVEYSEPSIVLVRGAAGAKRGCWMIGGSGLVLRARPDGGWERVTQPTQHGLVMVTATDHLIAAVTDDRGRTYRTTDGGATWR